MNIITAGQWPSLQHLDEDVRQRIELVCIQTYLTYFHTDEHRSFLIGAGSALGLEECPDGCGWLNNKLVFDDEGIVLEPHEIKELSGKKVQKACFGMDLTLPFLVLLTEDGEIWTGGNNMFGQLGHDGGSGEGVFHQVSLPEVRDVAVGSYHCMALTRDNQVYVWGANHCGQLGIGTTEKSTTPVKIFSDHGVPVTIAAQFVSSLVINEEGQVWMWGDNDYGGLGIGSNEDMLTSPVQVKFETTLDIKKVSCGAYHTLALTNEGEVYGWGWDKDGQLTGLGEDTNNNVQQPIRLDLPGNAVDIKCINSTSVVVMEDVYFCGEYDGEAVQELTKDTERRKPDDIFSHIKNPSTGQSVRLDPHVEPRVESKDTGGDSDTQDMSTSELLAKHAREIKELKDILKEQAEEIKELKETQAKLAAYVSGLQSGMGQLTGYQ